MGAQLIMIPLKLIGKMYKLLKILEFKVVD